MAECGGVGGSKGGANSAGGGGSVGAADKSANGSGNKNSAGKTDSQNSEAKTNNVDGAKSKTGIDREPQQKADLNAKTEAAKTDQKTDAAKTEAAKTEAARTQAKTEQTLADKIKDKAKEMLAKAEDLAKTAKTEFGKMVEKAKTEAALEAKRKEIETLARDPKVQAMLDTISYTEGTGGNYGKVVNGTVIGRNRKDMPYDASLTKGMKNVSTFDMSKHPNVAVKWAKGQKPSSAAGRYQFLSKTWQNVSQKLGLNNFHATSQDLAAVELMKERNMIEPLLDGDLRTAVTRGAPEWASLPKADGKGNFKGQKARAFADIERAYNNFLRDAEIKAQMGDYN